MCSSLYCICSIHPFFTALHTHTHTYTHTHIYAQIHRQSKFYALFYAPTQLLTCSLSVKLGNKNKKNVCVGRIEHGWMYVLVSTYLHTYVRTYV